MTTAFAVPANNIVSTVGAGGYTSGSGTLTLSTGQGANYPALTGSQFYRLTVIQAAYAQSPSASLSNLTIFRASALAGDTFTGLVATESTTDRSYASGDSVDIRVTAGTIGDIQTALNTPFVASGASHNLGMVPDPGAVSGTGKFLREDSSFAVPNMSNGQSVLGGNFSLTTTGSYQDTGLSVTVPAAGTYLINYNTRVYLAWTVGSFPGVSVKLFQTDTSADTPNSIRNPLVVNSSSGDYQTHAAFSVIATTTGSATFKLYAVRTGVGVTFTASQVVSDANGLTTLSYVRIA